MPRLKTCKLCGKSIQKNESFIPFEQRYAHESCFDNWSKVAIENKEKRLERTKKSKGKTAVKPKLELKENLSEEEYQEKVRYYEYFRTLLEDDITPKIRKLSEDYRRKYRLSFNDLYLTLVYMNEISNVELRGDIVGLLPFYISEAQNYFSELKRIEEENKNKSVKNMYKVKTICINPKRRIIKQLDIKEE